MSSDTEAFILADSIAWNDEEIAQLRDGIEVVGPIADGNIRTVRDPDEDVANLLVGLDDRLRTFLELAEEDVGRSIVGTLSRAVHRHDDLPEVAGHRITLTGVVDDVEVAVTTGTGDVAMVLAALGAWPRALELVEAVLERHPPGEMTRIEVGWTQAVEAWIVQQVQLAGGEVLPGPIFEQA